MTLTAEQEQLEHGLRVEQMTTTIDVGRVNIEKMRADMDAARAKGEMDAKWEARRFSVSLIVGAAALLGAGAAIGNYFANRTPAPPQVIYVLPAQPPATLSPPAPAAAPPR